MEIWVRKLVGINEALPYFIKVEVMEIKGDRFKVLRDKE